MNPTSVTRVVATCLIAVALCACKQEGPLPTYESATLESARSISGVSQAEAAASAAGGASGK